MALSAAAVCAALLAMGASGLCPKGFGAANSFPAEYKIPTWPEMPWEESAKLRTITLDGFKHQMLNEEYLEGPTRDFQMQGRETYWQASGQYFMYYCQRFRKWRIAEISAFSQNMEGQCYAFVSDAFPFREILNETLLKGFIEVEEGQWVTRDAAGVTALGRLGDQMEALEEADETSEACAAEKGEGEDGSEESKCPVMPVVRKARDKALQVAKEAGKWARRLFPKYLGAPDEEDAIPEDNPLFASEPDVTGEGCRVDTLAGCGFKEQVFIEKQRSSTAEKRKAELQRLTKIQDAVMKPDQKEWLLSRIAILQQLRT